MVEETRLIESTYVYSAEIRERALTGSKNNGDAAGIDQKKSGLNSESHILLIVGAVKILGR